MTADLELAIQPTSELNPTGHHINFDVEQDYFSAENPVDGKKQGQNF